MRILPDDDKHEFVVTAVDLADDDRLDRVAITLTDKRGGQVRLHLTSDIAEMLRSRLTMALERTEGP